MKKGKKIGIGICVLAVVGTSIFFANKVKNNHEPVPVMPVSMVNMGYWDDSSNTYANIEEASVQNILPTVEQSIINVYVQEGQEVLEGDPLLAYDVTSTRLALEMQELSVAKLQNQLEASKRKLQVLKNTTPIVIPTSTPEPTPIPTPTPTLEPTKPEQVKTQDAWNVLEQSNQVYEEENADGTYEHPYRFISTKDGIVYGSLFKSYENKWLSIEIHEDNTANLVTLDSVWKVNTSLLQECEDEDAWYVLTHKEVTSEVEIEPTLETIPQEMEDIQIDGYTAEELAQAIRNTSREIDALDLSVRREQLALKKLQKQSSDGIVRAEKNGIVTKVCSIDAIPNDGSPFLTVSFGTGVHVTGTISELMLDTVKKGTGITATDYQSGQVYNGQIEKISTIPTSNSSYYGGGNPNVSWYSFTAVLSDDANLSAGDGVQISFENTQATDAIWLSVEYLREDEKGQTYVMKDVDGKLVRQDVIVGRTLYGWQTEILGGLTLEDSIAFPYGKNVFEGAKTQESDGGEMLW